MEGLKVKYTPTLELQKDGTYYECMPKCKCHAIDFDSGGRGQYWCVLHASAQELLEACKSALKTIEYYSDRNMIVAEVIQTQLRQAIFKAEGRTA